MDDTKYLLSSPITFNRTSIRFSISVASIVLNEFAYIQVKLFDNEDDIVDTRILVIDGEDYQLWTNDQYLIDWTRKKLTQ
jgi:hypothetical protein